MPFFHVYTNAVTHEGKLQFKENALKEIPTHNDPASVAVHPYHPDTELFRYTYATFYDRIQDSDTALGKLIEMLENDDELDNIRDLSGDSTRGMGIGLSVCQSIIKAHGGFFAAGNDPEGGAVFRFGLPMEEKAYE